jgi:predicted O-methyltransferase YrrM
VNWLLQNFGQRLRFIVRNPCYTAGALYRELTLADERFLSWITGIPPGRIRSFLDEPIQTEPFAACLRAAESLFNTARIRSADLYAKKILVQYAAVRAFTPEVIVETGVASGVSSSYLLLALQKNGRGSLHSIELGDPSYLPSGKPPGWIVPEWLKARWDLHIGDSRVLLPQLLQTLGAIDVFIHDSLHTYEQMLWEFRSAYPFIRPGGLLFSDDAVWNPAFPEFCGEAAARRWQILRGVGFLQKDTQ